MRLAVTATVATLLGCTSTVARQAQRLYDTGDYAGAAKLADTELASHRGDDALWGVRIRALLAQGDAPGVATAYAAYHDARGGDDPELVTDLAIATLRQGLGSTSADVRIEAIRHVEELALEPLAEDVMDQMASDDDRIAAAAAVAVLRGHPQAPYLLEQLQHSDDPLARATAIEGIGRKVGPHAGDDLRAAAVDPDARVRVAAMAALAGLVDEASTAALAHGLADADATVRTAAARALASGKRGELASYARTALGDGELAVRLAGVALLGAARDSTGLVGLLTDPDPLVAVHAAAALRGQDPTGAAGAIDAALASEAAAVRATALNVAEAALGKDAALARGDARLADPAVTVRLAAARLVGYLGQSDRAIPVLAAELAGSERLVAAADLARLGDPRGADALSADARTARRAADRERAVRLHGTARRITPGLVAALADPTGTVRVAAAYELVVLARADAP